MEISDIHKQNILFDLIEQGADEAALELLRGDNLISEYELNKSLMSACQHGNKLLVQKLTGRGADINYRDLNGNTPLLISVQNGFTDIVQFLLTNKADVNAGNSVGDSALILSIGSSQPSEITENLLKQTGINIDHQNQDGYTAILKAVEVKNIDTLKILLDHYNNFNDNKTSVSFHECIDEHKTPGQLSHSVSGELSKWTILKKTVNSKGENVYQIAERCGMGNVLQLLQEHVETNISPLELAMRENDIHSFHIFLSSYADKNKKFIDEALKHIFQTCNDKHNSHFSENEISMIKCLLEHGANVNTTWDYKASRFNAEHSEICEFEALITTFHYTENSSYWNTYVKPIQIVAKTGCLKVLELLLSYQADVNFNQFENSPLNIALSYGHTECAKLLIQHGAVVDFSEARLLHFIKDRKELINLQDGDGLTALMYAVKYANPAIVKKLIDQGASVNMKDKHGNTALLHLLRSTKKDEDKMIKSLIQAGCDVNWQNNDGLSPLMVAAQKYFKNIMCVLLDSGAEINAVSKIDVTKTALTHLPFLSWHDKSYNCLELLLDRGASSSYLAAVSLHDLIAAGEQLIIPKLIRCGIGPVDVLAVDINGFLDIEENSKERYSPLCTALFSDNSEIARFFIENLFLTQSDISWVRHNQLLKHFDGWTWLACVDALNEMSQPLSLFDVSFVAVSAALGTSPGREIRVNELPVPECVKDKLLFKSQTVLPLSKTYFKALYMRNDR